MKLHLSLHASVFLPIEEFEKLLPRNEDESPAVYARRFEDSLQNNERMVAALRRMVLHFSSGGAANEPQVPNVLTWVISESSL